MKKKLISTLLALIIVMSAFPVSVFAENDILGYLTYEINNGNVIITDCDETISGKVEIPDTIDGCPVTVIGSRTFEMCQNISEIILPDSVTTIGSGAFSDTSISFINIPVNVEDLYFSPFSGCEKLTKVNWDAKNAKNPEGWSGGIFSRAGNKENGFDVIFSDTVESIPNCLFAGDGTVRVKNVKIGKNVKEIETNAFASAYMLESITIDKENEYFSIGEKGELLNKDKTVLIRAVNNEKIKEYVVPETVVEILASAFRGCDNITSVVISENVKYCGSAAFRDCENLEEIQILSENTILSSSSFMNSAYEKDEKNWDNGFLYIDNHLIDVQNAENFTIKDGTLSISEQCFQYSDISEIKIPDSVKNIGGFAFYGCDSLESIKISENTEYIGEYAFYGCEKLMSVTIPENVSEIGDKAFAYFTDYYAENNEGVIKDFTINGYTGSVSEKYASENELKFVSIGELTEKEILLKDNSDINVTGIFLILTPENTAKTLYEEIKNKYVSVVSADGTKLSDNTFVGTGAKVQLLDNKGKVLTEYTVLVKSDVNGDAKITAADARVALRTSVKLENLEGVFATAADDNGDNKITAADARKILRKSVNLE